VEGETRSACPASSTLTCRPAVVTPGNLSTVGHSVNHVNLHGFSSLMVATNTQDVTILFTDLGSGYW